MPTFTITNGTIHDIPAYAEFETVAIEGLDTDKTLRIGTCNGG
jgi:hypothetical protein